MATFATSASSFAFIKFNSASFLFEISSKIEANWPFAGENGRDNRLGSTQSSVNRYENGQSTSPGALFRRYADYFDVSLDYIFARTDKPQGVTYEFKPKAAPEREEMRRFIEMCFDPQSPMNEKLKETLLRMMEGDQ